MPTEVVMPQMGESITEGTITKWLKQPGEAVERDEPLFEISTDKVDAEIPSPAAGVAGRSSRSPEGATVGINTIVCTINEAGSAAAQSRSAAPSRRPQSRLRRPRRPKPPPRRKPRSRAPSPKPAEAANPPRAAARHRSS